MEPAEEEKKEEEGEGERDEEYDPMRKIEQLL